MARLLTDPDVATNFLVEVNGTAEEVPAVQDGNLTRLEYDLDYLADGEYAVRVNAIGDWGLSGYCDPLEFTKAVPGVPSGLRLDFT